jgi:hypothetical protein
MDISPPFGNKPRKTSPGEERERYADLAIMGLRLLGVTLTANERASVSVLIGAMVREAPKIKHSDLVKVLRLLEGAVIGH